MPPYIDYSELKLYADWDTMSDDALTCEGFPNSSKAVCKVLEEWTSDGSDGTELMAIDENDVSNFSFGDEVHQMDTNIDDLSPQSDKILNSENMAVFQKLAESMRRSQESRVALSLKICKAADGYERRKSVKEVLTSVQKSLTQIQQHFGPPVSA